MRRPSFSPLFGGDARVNSPLIFFLGSAAIFVALHISALFVSPFHDDWTVINVWRDAVRYETGWHVLESAFLKPTDDFWRPLPIFAFALVRGESALLPQALKLLAIVCLAWLFRRIGSEAGLTAWPATLLASAFLLHQCMVLGQEIDRWGDIWCGGAFLGLFYVTILYTRGELSLSAYLVSSALLTVGAVLGKESGVVAFAIPALVGVVRPGVSTRRRGHILAAVACLAVAMLYLIVRSGIGLGLGSTSAYYALTPGVNVIANAAMMVFALLSPVNTVTVVMGGPVIRVLSMLLTGAVTVWLSIVAYRQRRLTGRWIVLLALLFFALQGPTLLMQRTTEVNFTRSLPFGLLLIALILSQNWPSSSRRTRMCLSAALVVFGCLHLAATHSKVHAVIRASEQARNFRDQVQNLMPEPPTREVTFMVEKSYYGYSSFAHPLWKSIWGDADLGMRERYGRPDYRASVTYVDSLNGSSQQASDCDFVLDKTNHLHDRHGHSVLILPRDPYLPAK